MIRSLDLLYFRQKSLIKNIGLSNIELEGLENELIFVTGRISFYVILTLRIIPLALGMNLQRSNIQNTWL